MRFWRALTCFRFFGQVECLFWTAHQEPSDVKVTVSKILEYQQEEPVGLFCLDGRPHLQLVRVSQTNVRANQALLTVSSGTITQGGVS